MYEVQHSDPQKEWEPWAINEYAKLDTPTLEGFLSLPEVDPHPHPEIPPGRRARSRELIRAELERRKQQRTLFK